MKSHKELRLLLKQLVDNYQYCPDQAVDIHYISGRILKIHGTRGAFVELNDMEWTPTKKTQELL